MIRFDRTGPRGGEEPAAAVEERSRPRRPVEQDLDEEDPGERGAAERNSSGSTVSPTSIAYTPKISGAALTAITVSANINTTDTVSDDVRRPLVVVFVAWRTVARGSPTAPRRSSSS